MRATTILAIIAIVAALGAATSLIPIHQVSAAQGPNPGTPHSTANANPNAKQHACANAAAVTDFICLP
jgi:invasion protein IalB